MTTLERNNLFEEKKGLIDRSIWKHHRLARACGLREEDVRQELAVRMLEALDRYDADRCPNLDAYLMLWMKYRLWHMAEPSKRLGMPETPKKKAPSMLSLDARTAAGYQIDPPWTDQPEQDDWLEREIASLPEPQRDTVDRLLSGERVSRKDKLLAAACAELRKRLDGRDNGLQTA